MLARYSAQIKCKSTFINAFESSPVHCSKSLPSLKRRRPAYKGTAEILVKLITLAYILNELISHTVDQYHVLFQTLVSRHTWHEGSHSPRLLGDPWRYLWWLDGVNLVIKGCECLHVETHGKWLTVRVWEGHFWTEGRDSQRYHSVFHIFPKQYLDQSIW